MKPLCESSIFVSFAVFEPCRSNSSDTNGTAFMGHQKKSGTNSENYNDKVALVGMQARKKGTKLERSADKWVILNPFMPSELLYLSCLDGSISK